MTGGKLKGLVDEARPVDPVEPDEAPKLDPATRLPEGLAVQPLGAYQLDFAYLNHAGQFIRISAKDHSRNNLSAMFGAHGQQLRKYWPRRVKIVETSESGDKQERWEVSGFKADEAADALMSACAMLPAFKDAANVRGLGAWTDEDGGLIFHCGDKLWTTGGARGLGRHGGKIYAADTRLPEPYDRVVPAVDGPGELIRNFLEHWNWQRGELDAHLMLGWIGAAMVGGALDRWRPSVFVTGDAGTGKSTLQDFIKALLGEELIAAGDATEAGISQALGQSALPCILDEFEAEAGDRKSSAILRLMRLAASGEVKLRGSADHKKVEFNARSCFLFSAILMPSMTAAERTRLAILRLDPLTERRELDLTRATWAIVGRKLKRRFVDQWHRFAETLEGYRTALAEVGHSARGADQFGTLLACADIALSDKTPDLEWCRTWAKDLDAATLSETAEAASNAESCLAHLLSAVPDVWKGGSRMMVSQILENIEKDPEGGVHKQVLETYGLAVVRPKGEVASQLFIANSHRGTRQLFEGSDWEGRVGQLGAWADALRRLPGAWPGPARVGATVVRGTFLPMALCIAREPEGYGELDKPAAGKRTKEGV